MKPLIVILLILAAVDIAFNRGAVLLGIWTALQALGGTIRRGVWASQ